jgi:hypothetical protein
LKSAIRKALSSLSSVVWITFIFWKWTFSSESRYTFFYLASTFPNQFIEGSMLSSWTRLLRRLFPATRKASQNLRKKRSFGSKRYLLHLEDLEVRVVPSVYYVENTQNSGAGSLRQGILSGDSVIDFNIPTTDPNYNSATQVFTISPSSALPSLSTGVLIDGTSQSQFASTGYPVIDINGENAGSSVNGLDIPSSNCTIKGLAINNFSQVGIAIWGNNDSIVDNYVGTDARGTTAEGNLIGVLVYAGGTNDTVGGTSAETRNVISGNTQHGVRISGQGTNDNLVVGNFIGTNAAGTSALPNGLSGVLVDLGTADNTVGGTTSSASNLISGNSQFGVWVSGQGTSQNLIEGNFIGTNVNGTSALPNTTAGVIINNGATDNTIGGASAATGNLISGNSQYGVWVSDQGTSQNLIEGNFIGTNVNGTSALPNTTAGVIVDNGATDNTIGGASAAAGNLISGNSQFGVWISGQGTNDNVVQGNSIGTNTSGTVAVPNSEAGVLIDQGASDNTIGGTGSSTGNLISGNTYYGVWITSQGTNGNLVQGNFIGTDASGMSALPNGVDGVLIQNQAADNSIGGASPSAGNLISGNGAAGIEIDGSTTPGNLVEENLLGINIANTGAIANGIDIQVVAGGGNNTIANNTQLSTGAWTELSSTTDGFGTMLLLPNGNLMMQDNGTNGDTNAWYQLAPDSLGSYLDGSISSLANMNTQRDDYGSVVLPNGNVMVYGGEYSGPDDTENDVNSGEIYNPATNSWTTIASIPSSLDPTNTFGDDNLEVLPDGDVLAGYQLGTQTFIYSPTTNTWSAGPTKLDPGVSGYPEWDAEESWVKLPGTSGNILDYELWASLNQLPGYGNYLNTSTNQWVATGGVPVPLSNTVETEVGPAILLPSGNAFQIGANGTFGGSNTNTALYNPTTNSWTAGPTIPGGLTADDAAAAILPDSNVIFSADSSEETSSDTEDEPPTELFEYNGSSISQLTLPTALSSELGSRGSFVDRMLVLPTGQIALADDSGNLWLYSESANANPAWAPKITGISNTSGSTYTLTGTQLNGLDEGASYGDDAQMAENYPIVQLANSSGQVFNASTFNWSSTGVATGSAPVSTEFTLPANLAVGEYSLSVIADGISSQPVYGYYNGSVLSALPSVTSVSPTQGPLTGGTSVTITGTNLGNATAVDFGGVPASIASDSATQIVAESPAENAGIVDVTVTTVWGTSNTSSSDRFTVNKATPTFSNLSSPTITYGSASTDISGTLNANAGSQFVPAGEIVQVTLDGVTQNAALDSNDNFSTTFDTSTLGDNGSSYTLAFTYDGDTNFNSAAGNSTLMVGPAAPSFSNLSSPAITYGTTSTTISGTLDANAGGQNVPAGETIQVTFNGVKQNAPLDGNDNFSTTFNTGSLTASSTPYSIGFSYSGDSNFTSITGSSTLTVNPATPTFSNLSSPTITYGTTSTTISGTLDANSASQLVPPGETVQVTLNGVSQNATLTSNDTFSTTFNASSLAASPTPYTLGFSYEGDANFNAATDYSTLTVSPATPIFSNLSSPTITYGDTLTTISGTLNANSASQLVPSGEIVQVTIDGVTRDATLDGDDSFSTSFDTSSLGVQGSPYTVSFSYGGDANFNAASTNSSLNVSPASPTFSNLSSPTITYGDTLTTISGTLSANSESQNVPVGDTVQVAINGIAQSATLDNNDNFSISFSTSELAVTHSPYAIRFSYGGDANFNAANNSSSLTVNPATPTFSDLSSPTITYDTTSTTVTGTLEPNAGTQLIPAGETVQVSLNGIDQIVALEGNDFFSTTFNTSTLGVAGSPYILGFTYGGDTNFGSATATNALAVNRAIPSFSGLTNNPIISWGTAQIVISGTLNANASDQNVPAGETVLVELNGVTQSAALANNDDFSTTFDTSALTASSSPYTCNISYGGDTDFTGALGNETVSVKPGPVYPANSLVAEVASTIQLGGTTAVTLQARDPYGNDLTTTGLKVSFALENKTGARGTFSTVKDNHNGTYTAIFTGTIDGSNSITATVDTLPVTETVPITVAGGAVSLAQSIVTVASAQITAGLTTTVTLQAKYPKNNPEPAGGLTVAFKLGYTVGGQGTFSAVTDRGNGTYTAIFTGTLAGLNTIRAFIDGKEVTSAAPKITVVKGQFSPAKSPVTISATSMKASGAVTITFQPEDAGGNKLNLGSSPLPIFSVAGSTKNFGTPVYNSKTGAFTANFSTTVAGSFTFETMYNNQLVTSKTPTITVLPGSVSLANSTVKASETSVTVGTQVTVTVQTEDAYGNPEIEKLGVAFALASGSGKGTFGKVIYMGNGIYQATFTPASAGNDIIEALIASAKVKSTASLTVTA